MDQDVAEAALGLAAQRRSRARALGKKRIGNRAIGKSGKVAYFEQAVPDVKVFAQGHIVLRYPGGISKPLPQRQRNRRALLQVTEKMPVQGSRVAKILPHPFRRRSLDAVADSERALRGRFLQFVSQGVIVAPVAVMQKTSCRSEERRVGKECRMRVVGVI